MVQSYLRYPRHPRFVNSASGEKSFRCQHGLWFANARNEVFPTFVTTQDLDLHPEEAHVLGGQLVEPAQGRAVLLPELRRDPDHHARLQSGGVGEQLPQVRSGLSFDTSSRTSSDIALPQACVAGQNEKHATFVFVR